MNLPEAMFEQSHNLTDKDILASLDQDIQFYRNKLTWFPTYVMAAQAIVITGQRTLPGASAFVGKVFFTVFFAAVTVLSTFVRRSYAARVYYLRQKRIDLVGQYGYDVFHGPGGMLGATRKVHSPSYLLLSAVWLLSVGGILMIWLT